MKTHVSNLMMLWTVLFATSCLANTTPPDLVPGFTPPYTSIGIGNITRMQESAPGKWVAELKDANSLLGEKTAHEIKLHFQLQSGVRRPTFLKTPSQDWVGKTVLFLASKQENIYHVPDGPLALSPDGSPFFVWQKDSAVEIEAIRKVSALLSLDAAKLRTRLVELITDDTIPSFLKDMALAKISSMGDHDVTLRSDSVQHFLVWRDLQKLPIGIRLSADFYALLNSPRDYSTSIIRIEFLKSIVTSKEASDREKFLAQRRLEAATG